MFSPGDVKIPPLHTLILVDPEVLIISYGFPIKIKRLHLPVSNSTDWRLLQELLVLLILLILLVLFGYAFVILSSWTHDGFRKLYVELARAVMQVPAR